MNTCIQKLEKQLRESGENIICLGNTETVPPELAYKSSGRRMVCPVLTAEETDVLRETYYMYEFADNLIYIEENDHFPGLANFVKTGLLTEDEMWESLLK